jgi:hypothetical protein
MVEWLLAHDWAIQALAGVTLILVAGICWWVGRPDRPSLHDLGSMSRQWLGHRDRFRNSGLK